jgi:hypothetical protein
MFEKYNYPYFFIVNKENFSSALSISATSTLAHRIAHYLASKNQHVKLQKPFIEVKRADLSATIVTF